MVKCTSFLEGIDKGILSVVWAWRTEFWRKQGRINTSPGRRKGRLWNTATNMLGTLDCCRIRVYLKTQEESASTSDNVSIALVEKTWRNPSRGGVSVFKESRKARTNAFVFCT